MWAICLVQQNDDLKSLWFRAFKWSKTPTPAAGDEVETLPVTISYATKFKTKREAADMAAKRELSDFKILKTWW